MEELKVLKPGDEGYDEALAEEQLAEPAEPLIADEPAE